jgi:hypothetical protein
MSVAGRPTRYRTQPQTLRRLEQRLGPVVLHLLWHRRRYGATIQEMTSDLIAGMRGVTDRTPIGAAVRAWLLQHPSLAWIDADGRWHPRPPALHAAHDLRAWAQVLPAADLAALTQTTPAVIARHLEAL